MEKTRHKKLRKSNIIFTHAVIEKVCSSAVKCIACWKQKQKKSLAGSKSLCGYIHIKYMVQMSKGSWVSSICPYTRWHQVVFFKWMFIINAFKSFTMIKDSPKKSFLWNTISHEKVPSGWDIKVHIVFTLFIRHSIESKEGKCWTLFHYWFLMPHSVTFHPANRIIYKDTRQKCAFYVNWLISPQTWLATLPSFKSFNNLLQKWHHWCPAEH